jgi:colanic acid/amylovoran biosynthesis glycosyltransferase
MDDVHVQKMVSDHKKSVMKIGVTLNGYPVVSETFIETFLSHFEGHELVLFANLRNGARLSTHWRAKPYLNRMPVLRQIPAYFHVVLRMMFCFRRFMNLYKKGVPVKRLIADACIWTTDGLDVLHFPFGNHVFGREHYALQMGCKASLSFRGSDVNVFPVFHQLSYQMMWPYIQKVQANADELLHKLVQEHQLPAEMPSEVIHPALRDAFRLKDEQINTICAERSYAQEHFLTIGRLHWVKDYPLIFYALSILKQRNIPFRYTIIGGGPEREHLYYLANELGIAEYIEWKGSMKSDAILKLMQSCTLYLQSSLAEGFSNSCIEAQSQGLLCVVTQVSGMEACLENGKTGLISVSRRPEDFADALISMTELSDDERKDRSVYAAKRVRDLFTISRQRKQWLEFFETMN